MALEHGHNLRPFFDHSLYVMPSVVEDIVKRMPELQEEWGGSKLIARGDDFILWVGLSGILLACLH